MRASAIAVLVLFTAGCAVAADLDVNSAIDAVTVYPDGATVTRVIRVDLAGGDTTLIARDFPPSLDPASLRIEGEGAVTIASIDARAPRPTRPAANPALEQRLEALRDERLAIEDAIAAVTARKKFAERFATSVPLGLGDKGEARPLTEWRAAFVAVAEEIAASDAMLREAQRKRRDLDREIARAEEQLKGAPARKMEVRIDLAAEGPGPAVFRVSYTVGGARWAPFYDARLDTGGRDRKPTLELVRRAEIVQQTGEDWTDVALAVSTVRTAKGGSAPELRPLIVRFREQRDSARRAAPSAGAVPGSGGGPPTPAPAQEQEAFADTGGFQAVFRIPGRVTLASHEGAKSLRIASTKIEPALLVRAVPAYDETPFLEASFKHVEDAPLLPGRVAIYRDGIYVGRGQMPAAANDETVRLGFGADEKVKVARTLVRKVEGSTGFITSAKIDEREYKITVRSGHAQPIAIQVEDQMPVSENQDVVVELLPASTPPTHRDLRDRRGVLAWSFEAKLGESREIKLAWRVRWPTDKVIHYEAQVR